MTTTKKNAILVPFTCGYLLPITLAPWCFFEEYIFHLWSYDSRISFNFLKIFKKSVYEDLWSPLIFKEFKFSRIIKKILKRLLRLSSLFISVKNKYLYNRIWDYADIYYEVVILYVPFVFQVEKNACCKSTRSKNNTQQL